MAELVLLICNYQFIYASGEIQWFQVTISQHKNTLKTSPNFPVHLGLIHKALVHEKIQTHSKKEAFKRPSEAAEDASGTGILFLDCLAYAPCNQLHRP